MPQKFAIKGMQCAACVTHVEKALRKLGYNQINVNLLQNSMVVSDERINEKEIMSAVKAAGYEALPFTNKTDKSRSPLLKYFVISLILLIPLMYISMGHMWGLPLPYFLEPSNNPFLFSAVQLILTLAIIIINFRYFRDGIPAVFHGAANMNTLVSLGAASSFFYGLYVTIKILLKYDSSNLTHSLYFESAAMILTLITLGKYFEDISKKRTSSALNDLIGLIPDTCTIETDGNAVTTKVSDVMPNDIMIVKPGAYIVADGVITNGSTAVDESALTGESIPKDKTVGDKVYSGSVNLSGSIKIEATAKANESSLAKIIRMVEDTSADKAPVQRLADKISSVFVPIVVGISFLTLVIWLLASNNISLAINCAVSVLVISCPCALGLATPVAIMVSTGKAASSGILFKSAVALENLHKTEAVIFDKTGTLTEGKPSVTKFSGDKFILSLALSAEIKSEHPLAAAVTKYAEQNGAELLECETFINLPGLGIIASINGTDYYFGNRRLMKKYNIAVKEEGFPGTVIYVANTKIIGRFLIEDSVRPSAIKTVSALKKRGIHTVMLTGDNYLSAMSVADKTRINEVVSDVMPDDKQNYIKKHKNVCMVGDGINDAPALVAADVGIAIGAGTDIAIESADLVLIKNDPFDVIRAIDLSRITFRNIKQNLFWAFFYNCLGIPIAAGVLYPAFHILLSPMIAAALMSFSSVFVVLNALRIKRISILNTKGEKIMKYEIKIDGMMCEHCVSHVKSALESIDGVLAKVDLKGGNAEVSCESIIDEEIFKKAISNSGYKVISIRRK